MNNDIKETEKKGKDEETTSQPKHKQLIKMLTFRVVPAYYKEIEKVAKNKKTSVSTLIRTYIKEGLKKDKELSDSEEKQFSDSSMFDN